MPENIAPPADRRCWFLLFFKSRFKKSQQLGPDLSSPRAREAHGRFVDEAEPGII
jgi:hypothetical protein